MPTLACDFGSSNFPTGRKMQILYETGGALSSILASKNLPCFIGIGPSDENNSRDTRWLLILIPDLDESLPEEVLDQKVSILLQVLEDFCEHLNQSPKSHLLNPNQPTPSNLLH